LLRDYAAALRSPAPLVAQGSHPDCPLDVLRNGVSITSRPLTLTTGYGLFIQRVTLACKRKMRPVMGAFLFGLV